ncbi:MAG: hypothetical protein ACTSPN_12860 [Promethearchaeota archaeon]
MQKKTIMIITLILASGLIPSGIVMNNLINNEIAQGVPEALLGIKEELIPEINETIKTIAIPDVLSGIYEEGFPLIHFLVNCTFLAGSLSQFYDLLGLAGTNLILNYPTLSDLLVGLGYPPIKGVSEYHTNATTSLNYTAVANEALTFGNDSIGLPGLMEDVEVGWGVMNYLDLYEEAILNDTKKDFMITNYNATWDQLTNLTTYITDYFIVEAINIILLSSMAPPEYVGLTTVEIAEQKYYDQWANASMGQLDLGDLLGLPYSVIGFEAGYPLATNISFQTCLDIFNHTNQYSFLDITYNGDLPSLQESDGLSMWIVANGTTIEANSSKETLQNQFNLTDFQINTILDWLWGYNISVREDVVPGLFLYDRGVTVTRFSEILFHAQWANGTLYPNGLTLPIGMGVDGWEIGVPTPSTISLKSSESLFNEKNVYALVSQSGLQYWYGLLDNPEPLVYNSMKTYNDLTDDQVDAIIIWLQNFRDNVVPLLAQYQENLPFNPSILASGLLYGMTIPGGVLGALGVVMFIISKRKAEP